MACARAGARGGGRTTGRMSPPTPKVVFASNPLTARRPAIMGRRMVIEVCMLACRWRRGEGEGRRKKGVKEKHTERLEQRFALISALPARAQRTPAGSTHMVTGGVPRFKLICVRFGYTFRPRVETENQQVNECGTATLDPPPTTYSNRPSESLAMSVEWWHPLS